VDRESQLAAEFKALCTLCDEATPRKLKENLIKSLGPRAFKEPQHQIVFESICALFPRGPITSSQLQIHLNNRGFPDTDVEKYFSSAASQSTSASDTEKNDGAADKPRSERGGGKLVAMYLVTIAVVVLAFPFFFGNIRRFVRESLMQRVTSVHYEILCPPKALTQDSMVKFTTQREHLFNALNKKLGDADSNKEIRIVFDPKFSPETPDTSGRQPYSVNGTTIRTTLKGETPQLPPAADAESLLYEAWGEPGNPLLARWIATWLAGQTNGTDFGMAAAQVEQRLGHKNIASLLADPGGEISSPKDQSSLGVAWIGELAEFGGMDEVKKIYAAKMPHPNVADVTRALNTTPIELDRKWQMWMYAYLAGMPSAPKDSTMPMNMPMDMQGEIR
jgi:hypothetical protein